MGGDNSERFRLAFLICLHIVLSCVSLVYVSEIHTGFHILYDPSLLYGAIATVIAFAAVAWLFTFADFSFGYFVGFYLYTMVLGYLWLNCFSDFDYDHRLFGLSAAVSAVCGSATRFILISAAILTQVFLNVPLTAALLTYGAAIMFLLWYVTPRTMFEDDAAVAADRRCGLIPREYVTGATGRKFA